MPATSKTQQRLMGVAYAVKKGYMQLSDVGEEYRDKVADLINSMTVQQLKDFAETPHEGLPEEVKEASMGFAVNTGGPQSTMMPGAGMGNIKLPPSFAKGAVGSGDVPAGAGWAEDEYEEQKKRRKQREKEAKNAEKPVKTFEQFMFEKLKTLDN
jgi:hypothetical protein